MDLYETYPVYFQMYCKAVLAMMLFPLAVWLSYCVPSPTFWILETVTLIPCMAAYSNFSVLWKMFWTAHIATFLCMAAYSIHGAYWGMHLIAEAEILLLCTVASCMNAEA
jgi:hypothetical protein